MGLELASAPPSDAPPGAPSDARPGAPSDAVTSPAPPPAPPSDAAAGAPSDASQALRLKRPVDEEGRKREAERGRLRRAQARVKREAALRKAGLAPEEAPAVTLVPEAPAAPPLEPGQVSGWPPPSEIAAMEAALGETIATLVPVAAELTLTGRAEDDAVLQACFDVLARPAPLEEGADLAPRLVPGPAGARLAQAWAPVAARYGPAVLSSPWIGCIGGTLVAGVLVLKAARAAADAQAKQGAA